MNFLKDIFRNKGTAMYGLSNYDSNFDPKPKINWHKVYNILIIIGNVLFALWMICMVLKWLLVVLD